MEKIPSEEVPEKKKHVCDVPAKANSELQVSQLSDGSENVTENKPSKKNNKQTKLSNGSHEWTEIDCVSHSSSEWSDKKSSTDSLDWCTKTLNDERIKWKTEHKLSSDSGVGACISQDGGGGSESIDNLCDGIRPSDSNNSLSDWNKSTDSLSVNKSTDSFSLYSNVNSHSNKCHDNNSVDSLSVNKSLDSLNVNSHQSAKKSNSSLSSSEYSNNGAKAKTGLKCNNKKPPKPSIGSKLSVKIKSLRSKPSKSKTDPKLRGWKSRTNVSCDIDWEEYNKNQETSNQSSSYLNSSCDILDRLSLNQMNLQSLNTSVSRSSDSVFHEQGHPSHNSLELLNAPDINCPDLIDGCARAHSRYQIACDNSGRDSLSLSNSQGIHRINGSSSECDDMQACDNEVGQHSLLCTPVTTKSSQHSIFSSSTPNSLSMTPNSISPTCDSLLDTPDSLHSIAGNSSSNSTRHSGPQYSAEAPMTASAPQTPNACSSANYQHSPNLYSSGNSFFASNASFSNSLYDTPPPTAYGESPSRYTGHFSTNAQFLSQLQTTSLGSPFNTPPDNPFSRNISGSGAASFSATDGSVPSPGSTEVAAASSTPSSSKGYDYLLKFLLVGDSDVGKHEILAELEDGASETPYCVGSGHKTTVILLDGKRVKLQLWDTSGQGRFCTIIRSYSRGAQGILLVYDITNKWSFEGLDRWMGEIQEHAPGVPKVLIGNRLHLAFKRQVSQTQAEQYAARNRMSLFEVSPLCDFNISESFTELSRLALRRNGMERLWRANKVLSLQELCSRTIVAATSVYGIERLPLPPTLRSHLKSYTIHNPTTRLRQGIPNTDKHKKKHLTIPGDCNNSNKDTTSCVNSSCTIA